MGWIDNWQTGLLQHLNWGPLDQASRGLQLGWLQHIHVINALHN